MFRTRKLWEECLNGLELLWTHDGNPARPHALLTSGGHSDGFFNGGKFLFDYPKLSRELAFDLVEEIVNYSRDCGKPLDIDRTIGPAFGAITWADKIADAFNVGCSFTIPVGEGKDKSFVLEKRFSVAGQVLLLVEDTITSGGSVEKTMQVAKLNGAKIAHVIIAVCNRSGLTDINGYTILSMIDKKMNNWTPEECPLCKLGSKAIRPKEVGNWKLLSAEY